MKKNRFIAYCILYFLCTLCTQFVFSQSAVHHYPNLLSTNHFPKTPNDTAYSINTKGTWHSFTIPSEDDKDSYGMFGGPYCMRSQNWIAKYLFAFKHSIAGKGNVKLQNAKDIIIRQLPNGLYQKFVYPNHTIELELNPLTQRTSIYKAVLINTSDSVLKANVNISANLFKNQLPMDTIPGGLMLKYDSVNGNVVVLKFRSNRKLELSFDKNSYNLAFPKMQNIAPKDSVIIYATCTQVFIGDTQDELQYTNIIMNNIEYYFNIGIGLWEHTISTARFENAKNRHLNIKCLETVFANIRGPLPRSTQYSFVDNCKHYPARINVDDSWLLIASLLVFDKKMLEHQFSQILHSQNSNKSINKYLPIDDGKDINYDSRLNEKPMAAWTMWNIYSNYPVKKMLEDFFSIIESYHEYWYNYRDINNNRWCEDSEGIETVSLNAMLFTEKHCLWKMATELGYVMKATKYQNEIENMAENFNHYFFSTEEGQYLDYHVASNTSLTSLNAIEYAMWSGLASQSIADYYVKLISNQIKENKQKQWFTDKYLDLENFYFLFLGLKKYHYDDLAETLRQEIIDAYYIQYIDNKKPIQHYDPINDAFIENSPLNAAILLLLLNY